MEQPTTTTTNITNTTNINNTMFPNLAKPILESGGQVKPLYIPSQLIKSSRRRSPPHTYFITYVATEVIKSQKNIQDANKY